MSRPVENCTRFASTCRRNNRASPSLSTLPRCRPGSSRCSCCRTRPSSDIRQCLLCLVFGQRKADVEAGWNSVRPQHPDERRMEVCTVAVLGVTGPHRVSASPACPGFVVSHIREEVIIGSLGLGYRRQSGMPVTSDGKCLDLPVRRNQMVGPIKRLIEADTTLGLLIGCASVAHNRRARIRWRVTS